MDFCFLSKESGRGGARLENPPRATHRRLSCLSQILCISSLLCLGPRAFAAQAAYWPFDEGSGSTTADVSGNANNGTLTNSPTWSTGKIGSALTFNGTTQYVTAGTPSNLANLNTTGMTVMAWINPNSAGGGGGLGRIVDKGNSANSNGWWFTFLNATTIRMQIATFGGGPVLYRTSNAVMTMGVWQHVAATWDGSKNGTGVHIYVNGVLQDDVIQNATGTAQDDSAIALAIGNRAADGARGFDGRIDDVRIYNSVLTAAQIQAIANDSQPPTAPASPSATTASSTQINLSWTASTDNVGVTSYLVERCTGSSCTNFSQVASVTTTSYNNTGLVASTTYRYRIRATDAAGLFGAYSSIVSATTSAGGASVPAASAYWALDEGAGSSASDSSGNAITATLVNTPTWATGKLSNALSFAGTNQYASAGTPTTLANLNTTGMTVMAWIKPNSAGGGGGLGRIVDKGNTANSNGWWFTFLNPTTIRLQVATFGSPVLWHDSTSVIAMGTWQHVVATWDGSKNGSGVHIYVNGVLADGGSQNATGTAQSDSALTLAIGNRASDGARGFDGLIDDVRVYNSVLSAAQIQTIASDSQPPTIPASPGATVVSSSQINLSWTASTDNVGVTGYVVERCPGASCTNFARIATPSATTYNDTGLTASTTYRYRIRATDAAGLFSAYSSIVSATTQSGGGGGDVQAPTVPTNLSATPVSSSQINLSWTGSTDNVAVTGYEVQRCTGASCTPAGSFGTPTGTTFSDTGLSPSTTYRYAVRARDAVPNWSLPSSIATATTLAPGDTTPPTAPTALQIVAASSNEIDLVWTASSDNVGVTTYVVERCSTACPTYTQAGTVTTPTPPATLFYNTALSASTSYSYRVYAKDAAGNPSPASNVVTYVTPASSVDCNN